MINVCSSTETLWHGVPLLALNALDVGRSRPADTAGPEVARKATADARLALNFDTRIVTLQNMLHDRQAQSDAAIITTATGVNAKKTAQ